MTNEAEASSSPIEQSLKRLAESKFQFVLLEKEEIMDGIISKKKQKQKERQVIKDDCQEKYNVSTDLLASEEDDRVFVGDMQRSVGTHIKQEALVRYPDFFELCDEEKSIVSLGLNSIIDLSESHPRGQSALFEASH